MGDAAGTHTQRGAAVGIGCTCFWCSLLQSEYDYERWQPRSYLAAFCL